VRELLAELASALLDDGRPAEAARHLEDALTEAGSNPSGAEIHHRLGQVELTRSPKERLSHLLLAVGCGLHDGVGVEMVATAAREARHVLDESALVPDRQQVESLHGALREAPPDLADDVALLLGVLKLALDEPADAARHLHNAVDGDVAFDAYFALATARERLGKDAREVLGHALELAPDPTARTVTNRRLAEAALVAGEPEEALHHLDGVSMEALEPSAVEPVKLLTAAAQLAAGRPHDALEAHGALASRGSIEATRLEIQIRLAIAAETGTDDPDVLELANRLLERDPLGTDSILVRAQAMIETGADISEGRRLLRTVAGRLAASAAAPAVLQTAARGRPDDDLRMQHVLAETHSALARDSSTAYARDRHLEEARAHLVPLVASSDDGDTTVRTGAILRLDAELQPTGTSADVLSGREVRAGDALLDEGDALGAMGVLRGTVDRPAAPQQATWLLTEAMRLRAVQLGDADESGASVAEVRKLITDATQLWDLKFADEAPTDDAWWAYAARALLAYQRSTWVDDQPLAAAWEAIAFQHVAVLREPWSPRLLLLAQLLRLADLDVSGLVAAEEAVEVDDSPLNMTELCVGQLNTGDIDGALETIGTLRARNDLGDDVSVADLDELEAYAKHVRLARGDLEHARKLLDGLPDDKRGASALALGAELLELAGEDTHAAWEATAAAVNRDEPWDIAALVKSLVNTGHPDEGIKVADDCLRRGWVLAEDVRHWLGLAELAAHDGDGERVLTAWVGGVRSPITLRKLVDVELVTLSSVIDDAVVDRVRAAVDRRLAELASRPREPSDDLATFPPDPPTVGAPWRALCAAMVGLVTIRRDPDGIEPTLRALRDAELEGIPARVAEVALQQAQADVRRVRIDRLRAALGDDGIEPATALTGAEELIASEPTDAVELATLASYAAALAGQDGPSRAHLDAALAGSDAAAVGEAFAGLLVRPGEYVELVGAFGALGEADRVAIDDALAPSLARLLGIDQDATPFRRELRLELGKHLLPADPYDPKWPLLDAWIPEMKQEITSRFGITLPGVTVSVAAAPDEFVMRINDGVVQRGVLASDGPYTPASVDDLVAAGVPRELLTPVTDPLTGAPGCWIDTDELPDEVREQFSPDRLRFIARSLGAVLRRHLGQFVAVDELDVLARAEGIELEPAQLATLHAVARELLADLVPLTPIGVVVKAIEQASSPTTTTAALVDAVRLLVRDRLPGNRGEPRVGVPAELEAALQRSDGQLAMIASLVGTPEGLGLEAGAVLVVRDGSLRRGIRRLVAPHHPDVAVITAEEALPG
jgi:tetratricopeptide (TPR) repeat protein